ncbi:MAG: glycosyltransferase family 2 protein [Candidatus Levybacteria bacterium]|nr:glycosyltransferase family 2 protein [Candidatus Levybacteria bacterium]
MKLSIIIPTFNEERTIIQVLDKIIKLDLRGVEKEIIVIDDGSIDSTVEKIKNMKYKNIILIIHTRNQGKGAAVLSGIKKTTGDYIIVQDADLEYDPKYIHKLLQPIIAGKAQVVYGTRLKRRPNIYKEENNTLFFIHYFGNRFLSLVTSILYGQWLTDMETGYKIFPKKIIAGMKLNSKSFDFEPEITAKLLKRKYYILEIPITTTPRGYDQGKKLNTIKDGIIALWTLLKYRFVD